MRASFLRRLIAVAALIVLVGCAGDKGTGPKNDGNGGGTDTTAIPISVRTAAMELMLQKFDSLSGLARDSVAVLMTAYLNSLEVIDTAGNEGLEIWGIFTDGRLLSIPNNREVFDPSDTVGWGWFIDTALGSPGIPANSHAGPFSRGHAVLRREAAGVAVNDQVEIPSSQGVRLLNTMEICYPDPTVIFRPLFKNVGYIDAGETEGSIAALKRVKNDAFFHINAHGGVCRKKDRTHSYAVWTTDLKSDANELAFDSMLRAGELAYMLARGWNPVTLSCNDHWRYAITPAFVTKYMSFGKNSMVFFDCCSSDNAALKAACTQKGASEYLGWSDPVGAVFALKAAFYLVDRLLGANHVSPQFTPKQRQFDIFGVWITGANNGYWDDTDPEGPTKLVFSQLRDGFGAFRPIIDTMTVMLEQENRSELWIYGIFGTDRGSSDRRVKMNDAELTVIQWEPRLIRCELPVTGTQSIGKVVVGVRGEVDDMTPLNYLESNSRNLTKFKMTFNYARTEPGTLHDTVAMNIIIRADLDGYRRYMDLPLEPRRVSFDRNAGSSGTAKSGGIFTSPLDGECQITYSYDGSLDMGSAWNQTDNGYWDYYGEFNTETKRLNLSLTVSQMFNELSELRIAGTQNCLGYELPFQKAVMIDECLSEATAEDAVIRITTDSLGVAFAGSRQCTAVPYYYYFGYTSDGVANVSIQWDDATVEFPPDPDVPK